MAAPAALELLQKLVIAGLTFYFAIRRLAFKPGFFLEREKPTQVNPPMQVDEALLTQLSQLMDKEKFWRTEGLTIRLLAEKMNVKEYKLRKTINQHLDFRNFNDYLHSYRIKEACHLLSDSRNKELTILEIAYEIGYNFLAPFNKAFKTNTGMTPTAWRRSKS